MNGLPIYDESARKIGYFTFMDRDEKTVLCVKGILDNTINGYLILTNKKLFFYYWSNVNRENKFIATYPYISSVKIRSGILSSTLNIKNRKETFRISKIKNRDALNMFKRLMQIIADSSL